MPPRTPLLLLTDAVIDALATNRTVVANFESCFGRLPRAAAAGCGRPRCREALRAQAHHYNAVRDCLAGLPAEKKLLLKRLLNAEKLRLDVIRPDVRTKTVLT